MDAVGVQAAGHRPIELLELLAAADLAALLLQRQPMLTLAVQEPHADIPVTGDVDLRRHGCGLREGRRGQRGGERRPT